MKPDTEAETDAGTSEERAAPAEDVATHDALVDNAEMPFMAHVVELRQRILLCFQQPEVGLKGEHRGADLHQVLEHTIFQDDDHVALLPVSP